ncbi:hypothetical protein A6X21_12725 [Planctopirus hydrillae]|uniref:Putative Flp pilus-assembly TadG-like N-terminal domain-containing protein n=2 Tax=Planctopirus hydrillae TaxID=1841610 RepID=A0A1C3E5Y4_9PLAN|nr:hypothetical protein A6X21_12725 [Planctopirus hydrillae]
MSSRNSERTFNMRPSTTPRHDRFIHRSDSEQRFEYSQTCSCHHRGAIAVHAAICMLPIMLLMALVVDVGLICMTNAQLQQAADASAISAAHSLVHSMQPTKLATDFNKATSTAHRITVLHPGAAQGEKLRLANQDLEFLNAHYDRRSSQYVTAPVSSQQSFANAVRVSIRRDESVNSRLSLSFSHLMGLESTSLRRDATAAFFPATEIGEGAEILPIAVDATVWTTMRLGNHLTNQIVPYDIADFVENISLLDALAMTLGKRILDPVGVPFDLAGNPLLIMDRQSWNSSKETVTSGSDGVWEGLFLPHQLERTLTKIPLVTGLTGIKYVPGNMVVIDLGKQASSSKLVMNLARLERQLVTGLDIHDVAGVNAFNGTTGETIKTPFSVPGQYYLPKELKEELTQSIGKPKILFLYATIPGVITTAKDLLQQPTAFVIVGWVGAVVTEVNFDSTLNYVKLQPAPYHSFRLGKGDGSNTDFSSGVYAGPYLIE